MEPHKRNPRISDWIEKLREQDQDLRPHAARAATELQEVLTSAEAWLLFAETADARVSQLALRSRIPAQPFQFRPRRDTRIGRCRQGALKTLIGDRTLRQCDNRTVLLWCFLGQRQQLTSFECFRLLDNMSFQKLSAESERGRVGAGHLRGSITVRFLAKLKHW